MQKTRYLTRLVILISLTLVIEMLGLPQPITGPLVNMMLFLTTLMLGASAGMALGTITPLVALLRGQLPPVLFAFVPFIIIGNALLVIVYFLLSKSKKYDKIYYSIIHWIGVISAATVKFMWLFLSAKFVLPLVFGKALPPAIITVMAIPQLVTALIGGVLATIIFNFLQRFRLLK
jgi:hypothetical protein